MYSKGRGGGERKERGGEGKREGEKKQHQGGADRKNQKLFFSLPFLIRNGKPLLHQFWLERGQQYLEYLLPPLLHTLQNCSEFLKSKLYITNFSIRS